MSEAKLNKNIEEAKKILLNEEKPISREQVRKICKSEEEVDLLESMLDVVSLNESLGTGIGSAARGIGRVAQDIGYGFKNTGAQIKAGFKGTSAGTKSVRDANKTRDKAINVARQNRAEARALSNQAARLKTSEQKQAVKAAKEALKNNTDKSKTAELKKNLETAKAAKKSRFANWKDIRKDINEKYKLKKQAANATRNETIRSKYNEAMAKFNESFSDLDLMHILDESGYEASIENLAILKEGLETGEYEIR